MNQATLGHELRDRTVLDQDGEKLGKIKEIYDDQYTGKPEWATVAGGLFGLKTHFVPLAGASTEGEDLRLPITKDQVTSAPSIEADGELSEPEERRLFEHYGIPYTTEGSTTAQGPPGGQGAPRAQATGGHEDAMTRSEEELRVGTAERERGRARLRKYVVTEEVQQTIPVRREEVRVEREPITEANVDQAMSGPEISEAEHEVVLHEEEPVVEKRAVPKERVRLEKDTVIGEQEVSEELRKERIETEGDARG